MKGKSGGNVDALSGVSLSVSFFFVCVSPLLFFINFHPPPPRRLSFVVVLLFFEKKKRWVGERSALTQAKQRAPPPAPCVCAPRYSYTDQWQSGNGGVSSALSRLDASHLSPLTRALFSSLPLFSFFHPLLILLLFFPTSPTIFFLFWPFPPFDVVRSCPRSQRACRSPAFLLALSLLSARAATAAMSAAAMVAASSHVTVYSFIISIIYKRCDGGSLSLPSLHTAPSQ